jgi:hypothetical protein
MVPEDNAGLRAVPERILRLASWFALAYLGYWLALGIDRILMQGVVYPLLGMKVTEWSVTAFRIRIANSQPTESRAELALSLALPLILELGFLSFLACWGTRLRSAFLRITTHFAGLWLVLLLTTQGAILAYWGSLRLGQSSVQIAALVPGHGMARIAITAVVALLLLAFGKMCARRLIAELYASVLPARGQGWLVFLMLILPVLVILAGSFGFVLRFFGPRAMVYLVVPAGFCLLLALLGLLSKLAPPLIDGKVSALSYSGIRGALFASVALYAGLHEAPRLQLWQAERHLERLSSSHYEILYDPRAHSPEAIWTFVAERERTLAAQAVRLNQALDASADPQHPEIHLRVVLYPNLSSMRLATSSERPFRVDGTTIRAVVENYISGLDPAADAAALLHAAWGPPGAQRMDEWVARWLAGEWRGRAVDDWATQIESEVGHYTLAQLVAGSSDELLSPLVRNPLGAAWVGTIFERSGLATVRKLYSAKLSSVDAASLAAQLGLTPAQLEQDWGQWTTHHLTAGVASPPPQRQVDPGFFFRGISFSHEGWAGRGGGYVSPEAADQLRQLSALGANAIAVVPYGFARSVNAQAISYTGTDETDEDLAHALHVAHGLGMKVMLKPQLWVRGGYTGAMRFDDPVARAAWMRSYREFILHYARLAELEQFDLLSIGTEFERLTPYADDWRRLIADVRRVYHGPLTYAANWGHEFESIAFWDVLDYMGVNDYYPLGAAPATHVEELLPGAQRLAAKLEALSRRWRKPVLLTEVGYPSTRGGSSEPWIEDAGRNISLEEQAAAYEATFRAFAGQPWLRGMFWWKWPSSGRGGGPRDASYTPLGKPAVHVLHTWFTRLASAGTTKLPGSAQAP